MTVSKTDNVLPAAIRTYSAGLVAPSPSRVRAAAAVDQKINFVFNGLTPADLQYDTSQYPVSGTYAGITPPWFNSLDAAPNWQWTQADQDASTARGEQVKTALSYIHDNVPNQTYSGTTTAQIIQQWYTQGMWAPSVFPAAQTAALTQNWIADDAEFARQRLGGANPNVIMLASGAAYDVGKWIAAAKNGAALGALLGTLQKAQEQGALFVCDYTAVLGPVVKNRFVVNGRFFAAPICYFTVDTATNALVPQAIQITATDGSSYIFTPGDPNDKSGDAWLLAKLWVASADQQWWFSGSHLFNTHSIDLIFGTAALMANQGGALAENHPMLILAQPYLIKSFSINDLVINAPAKKQTGIYQNSTVPEKPNFCDAVLPTGRIGLYQIITDLYQGYRFDANAFPAQMASRGLQSGPMASVAFPYRDDGQVWWNALQSFVGQIVDATYANDAAVAADAGLNAWMKTAQGAFNHDGANRFTWTPTVAYLKSAFTNLLFLCSAQHTAVNDTMFPAWAFTPNGAFAMAAAPPADAASVTRQTVLGSLPNPQNAGVLLNIIENQISFVMSGTSIVTEVLAGSASNPESLSTVYPYAAESPQQKAVTSFWNAIWTGSTSVNAVISGNQARRVKSWTGSTPVPNSLAYYYLSPGLTAWAAPQYLNAPAMNAIQI